MVEEQKAKSNKMKGEGGNKNGKIMEEEKFTKNKTKGQREKTEEKYKFRNNYMKV
jgi:hypothetical protein